MDTTRTPQAPNESLETLIVQREVQRITGCSKATIDRAVQAGDLPVIRLARTRRFLPSDVRSFIAQHRTAGARHAPAQEPAVSLDELRD